MIQDMEKKTEETLSGHREALDLLDRELLEKETLSKDEIEELLRLPPEKKPESR
jgi:ATP-dependent Zn protease